MMNQKYGGTENFGSDLIGYYMSQYGYIPENAFGVAPSSGNGILSEPNPSSQNRGALSGAAPYIQIPNSSQNRRSAAPMNVPPPPSRQIGTNEALMRIGGKMIGGSAQGGLNALQAATDEFGAIQDANRGYETQDYNSAVLAKLREAQAQKAMNAGKGKGSGTGSNVSKQASSDIVNDAGARALEIIQNDINDDGALNDYFTGATGWAGLLSGMPNSKAKTLGNLLTTIKGNAGFDKLQAMREASPTGGALGQVSVFELEQLNAAFGNLDQTNNPVELRENLINLIHVYNNIIHGEGNHPYPPASQLNLSGSGSAPQSNPDDEALVRKYLNP